MSSPTAAKFLEFEVTPKIVDQAPAKTLAIKYTTANKEVNLGNELTPEEVKEVPVVSWNPEGGAFYTLVFTDPDVPSRENPVRGEFLHWVVANIPGNDLSKGEVLAGYVGSAPPKGSGLHRYVFVLYKHQKKLDYKEKFATLEERRYFSVKKFAAKYELGAPVEGNFYQAQCDAYAEEFHRKLAAGEITPK